MDYWKQMYGTQSKEFIRGVVAGLKAFAWWKDGIEYIDHSAIWRLKDEVKKVCLELGWKEEWGNPLDY